MHTIQFCFVQMDLSEIQIYLVATEIWLYFFHLYIEAHSHDNPDAIWLKILKGKNLFSDIKKI